MPNKTSFANHYSLNLSLLVVRCLGMLFLNNELLVRIELRQEEDQLTILKRA
jgi:hypothetical protein